MNVSTALQRVGPLALVIVLAGCFGPAASSEWVIVEDVVVGHAQDGFVEYDLAIDPGGRLVYDWRVQTPGASVAFNVHTHTDGRVDYVVEVVGRNASGEVTPPGGDGVVSAIWSNAKPNDAVVTVRLGGEILRILPAANE